MNTLRYSIAVILGFALPYLVQRWDRARLPPEGRAAAWNGASWGAALYAFGPLSMLGWAVVTRARLAKWEREGGAIMMVVKLVGLLVAGAMAAVLISVVIAGVDWGFAVITGAPE
ncbi:Hypothetical protein A7982_05491 [Minicystis rosea]|nr:Hypothetical protein A7982_05491 [Minicystis rosea]